MASVISKPASKERRPGMRSMIGLASMPGTEVLPMWWISTMASPPAARTRSIHSAARSGQAES